MNTKEYLFGFLDVDRCIMLKDLSYISDENLSLTYYVPTNDSGKLDAMKNMVINMSDHILFLQKNGKVRATGKNDFGQCNTLDWINVVQIAGAVGSSYGLKKMEQFM